jgi:hypothetical protein
MVHGIVEVGNAGVEESKVDLNIGLLKALHKGRHTSITA